MGATGKAGAVGPGTFGPGDGWAMGLSQQSAQSAASTPRTHSSNSSCRPGRLLLDSTTTPCPVAPLRSPPEEHSPFRRRLAEGAQACPGDPSLPPPPLRPRRASPPHRPAGPSLPALPGASAVVVDPSEGRIATDLRAAPAPPLAVTAIAASTAITTPPSAATDTSTTYFVAAAPSALRRCAR